MNDPSQRLEFLKDLARLVDGEPEAEARHAALLADNPGTVELLAQARVLAARLGAAGDDYRPDPELQQRLAAALPEPSDAELPQAQGQGQDAPPAPPGPAYGRFPSIRPDPEEEAQRPDPDDAQAPLEAARRSPLQLALAALGMLVVGGAAAYLMWPAPPPPPPPPPPPVEAQPPALPPLSWEIAATRHAGEAPTLLSLGADDQPGEARAAGDQLVAGQGLSTGANTRALLHIGELGRAIAGVDSALRLDPENPRALTLLRGSLLIDLHGDLALTLRGATGARVELRQCLTQVTVVGDALWLESLRGEVELGQGPSSVGLQPGQQASFSAGEPPRVSTHLAELSAPRFSDFDDGGAEPAPPFGTLSAIRTAADGDAPAPTEAAPAKADAGTGAVFDPAAAPRLLKHRVEVQLQGPLATTTHTQHFAPPGIDGVVDYRVPLPPDAMLLELSIEQGGKWQPAHQQKAGVGARAGGDPGAWYVDDLPMVAGEPLGLRVRYVQWLTPTVTGARYSLPLPLGGGVAAGELQVEVHSVEGQKLLARPYPLRDDEGGNTLTLSEQDFEPTGTLHVDVLRPDPGAVQVWREPSAAQGGGDKPVRGRRGKPPARLHAVLALRPEPEMPQPSAPAPVAIVVDTSQHVAGPDHQRAMAIAAELLGALSPARQVAVFACDATCLTAGEDALRDAAALRQWLAARGAAGALHLPRALTAGLHVTDAEGQPPATIELIYVGSAGTQPVRQLPPALHAAVEGGRAALTTVAIGPGAAAPLRALARLGSGHGLAPAADTPAEDIARAVLARIARPRIAGGALKLPAGLEALTPPESELAIARVALPSLREGERLFAPLYVGGPELGGKLMLAATIDGRQVSWERDAAQAAVVEPDAHFVQTLFTLAAADGRTAQPPDLQPPIAAWPRDARGTLAGSPVRMGRAPRPENARLDADPVADRSAEAQQALADVLPLLQETLEAFGPETPPSPRAPRVRVQTPPGSLPGAKDRADAAREAAAAPGANAAAHAAYVRALSQLDDLEQLRTAVAAWRTAMPQHPAAILAEVDLWMRAGQPLLALRSLEGLTERYPRDMGLRRRIIDAFTRAGLQSRTCLHRVALARQQPDTGRWLDAVRCLQAAGEEAWAEQLVADLPEGPVRAAADALLAPAADAGTPEAATPAAAETPRVEPGRLGLSLTCKGEQDVDLTVVTLQGRTLSWLGGRRDVRAADARTAGKERLSLDATPGIYTVSAHRLSGAKDQPLACELRLAVGEVSGKPIPFELSGMRHTIARVVVEAP